MTTPETITIRTALPADVRSLRRLGELDSRPHLVGALLARGGLPADFLIAEVDGELWAAVVTQTGELLANPWRATAEIAKSLRAELRRRSDDNQRRKSNGRPLFARPTTCRRC